MTQNFKTAYSTINLYNGLSYKLIGKLYESLICAYEKKYYELYDNNNSYDGY
jgi:hypothetical protein